MSVYFVYLRRPSGPDDRRNDPFWEFGSFGKTGCHSRNLLHPRKLPLKAGDRLAFLQGGDQEIRVIGLTPLIQVAGTEARIELKWDKNYRPLPYSAAPLLISNNEETDFPGVVSWLRLDVVHRSTSCGKTASRLRSRSTPMNEIAAQEIALWFAAPGLPRIEHYAQAVQPESTAWYGNAVQQGWVSQVERSREYKQLGLLRETDATSVKGDRRRC